MIHRLALPVFAAILLPAAAGAATYAATPVAPVAVKRIVVRDIVWACGPSYCLGNTGESRPLVLCQGLAKRTGRLESFAVDGRPLAAPNSTSATPPPVAARRLSPATSLPPNRATRAA